MSKQRFCRLRMEQLEPRIALSSYYVSLTGNNNNNGLSLANAWQTIQYGTQFLLPGDILNVESGTYAGFINGWDPPNSGQYSQISGTAAAPITIRKDPTAAAGSVIINSRNNKTACGIDLEPVCSYITLDGFTITNDGSISQYGIKAAQATNITITNCNVSGVGSTGIFTSFVDHALVTNNVSSNNGEHGIYMSNSPNYALVSNNTCSGNASAGIQFNADISQGPPGVATNNVIENNILSNNGAAGAAGINLDGFQNGVVENNLIYNEHSTGIVLYDGDAAQGCINNVIANNTVLLASDGRWCVNINTGSTGNTLFNNILYNAGGNGTITIDSSSLSGTVSDYNVVVNLFQNNGANETLAQWQSQTGQDKHSIISTPSALFVNVAGNNYQLSATSPAVDAGVSQLAGHNAPTVDIVGTSRPQGSGWDIGAYERVVTNSAVATHFSMTAPASTTAGSAFSVTVTALTASNTTATSYTGTVHFSSSDGAALLPADYTFTAVDTGVHTFSNGVTLKTAGAKSVTATDKTTSSITGNASTTVNPAAANGLRVSGFPSSTTAGMPQNFTVTALDAYGNTATGYRGSITFGSTDSNGVLPANYTFTSTDAGIHVFSATLKTAGTRSLSAKDSVTSSISGTESGITVTPAAANSLLMSGFPSSTTAGVTQNFTVTALDAYGNTATGYTGTITLSSTDAKGVLPANYTFTSADAGIHSFYGTLKTVGSQSFTAKDSVTSSISGTESGITVTPAAANSLLISGFPPSATAGVAQNFAVTSLDAYGNTATGYLGTISFSSTDTRGALPANYTFSSADGGIHSFSATLRTAGSQSLTAKDTIAISISGSQTGITVSAAAANHLVLSRFPSITTAGVSQSFRVTVQDLYANTVASYTGTVTFSSSDIHALLPTNYSFTSVDAGVHTFSAALTTAGSQSLSAKDSANTSIAGGLSGIMVKAAATSQLQVTGFPLSLLPGGSGNFTVTAQDAFGNTTTGYTGTLIFASSDLLAILPANYTFTSTDAGVHTFTATLKTAGVQSISATDTLNAAIKGTESGISVVMGQPTAGISGPSSGVPGQPFTYAFSASESGPATSFTYSVTWGDSPTAQTFSGSSGTHVYMSPGNYMISLIATDASGNASVPVTVSVAITSVLMEADPSNSSLTALYVGGTTGSDNIAISPVIINNVTGVMVGMNFVNYGNFFPTGHVVIFGQLGNDIIKTAAQSINGVLTYVNVPLMIFAGNGNNVLNVSGSSVGNVLVGGSGADRLIGGLGPDVLIGGSGSSTLNAGSGGDILIGGTTNYDTDAVALASVLAEWSSGNTYATRMAHLMSGGGLNTVLLTSSTVHADSSQVVNDLYGGPGMDWYFAGMMDVYFNRPSGEIVTSI